MMKSGFLLYLVLLALLSFGPARAEDFIPPSWPDLARTLVKFKAIDTDDDKVIDDYGTVTECKLYQAFYRDDFQWNKVRGALRENIRNHSAGFPAAYGYPYILQLDHYDFQAKLFRLSDKTPITNINAFRLFKQDGRYCGEARIKQIPAVFRAVLASPVFIPGLPLSPEDAAALLARMQASGNTSRTVHARFNLHIVYIEPLRQPPATPMNAHADLGPAQSGHMASDPLQLDTRLDSVDFFEDAEMTKLIYSFKP